MFNALLVGGFKYASHDEGTAVEGQVQLVPRLVASHRSSVLPSVVPMRRLLPFVAAISVYLHSASRPHSFTGTREKWVT
eukprot:COSAG02_NODE_18558_length_932_cov_1.194478_1_plen_78_part_01